MKPRRIILLPGLVLMVCVALCAATAEAATSLTGRHEVDGSSLWSAVGDIGKSVDTVIHQTGYSVYYCNDNSRWFGYNGAVAAYLMEGGVLTNRYNMKVYGSYGHFRQTGGQFYKSSNATSGIGFTRPAADLAEDMLPFDLVFGGNAYVSNLVNGVYGDRVIAAMDNADVQLGTISGANNGLYKTTICANGGDLWGA